jgi:hypothetical protein
VEADDDHVVVFNSLSMPRAAPAAVGLSEKLDSVSLWDGPREIPCQIVSEGESSPVFLAFVAPEVPAFGVRQFELKKTPPVPPVNKKLVVTPEGLESPFYRVTIDRKTGAIASLVHKATGREVVVPGPGRSLGQSIYFDGQEHLVEEARQQVVGAGPVMAAVMSRGKIAAAEVLTTVLVDAELDRVGIHVEIKQWVSTGQQVRLCQVFPVGRPGATLRVATPGAVVRPRPQPEGDFLPGADLRRFCVQEFVDVSGKDFGVTIAPGEAFALRLDLDPLSFEALGNDQNYKEVSQDQGGQGHFSFGYAVRAHAGDYRQGEAYAWSRDVQQPLLATRGRVAAGKGPLPRIVVDPARAIATCLKPADGQKPEGVILRLQEVGGRSGPLSIGIEGYRTAVETDLLERDLRPLPIRPATNGMKRVEVGLKPHGLAAVRLVP